VWEHAYYLNYQNKRAEYVDKWWGIIDWAAVSARYEVHVLCSKEKKCVYILFNENINAFFSQLI
jgi:hypothetical protein